MSQLEVLVNLTHTAHTVKVIWIFLQDAFMSKLLRAVDDEKALEGNWNFSISHAYPALKATAC
jgi:hypothetical protein